VAKYRHLWENDVGTIRWQTIEPEPPYFFFVPKRFDLRKEYELGWKASRIFRTSSLGVEFGSKQYLLAHDRANMATFVRSVLLNPQVSDDVLAERYGLNTTSGWRLRELRRAEMRRGYNPELIVECLESPFNTQYTYHSSILRRPQLKVLHTMHYPNKAMLTLRQSRRPGRQHFFVTNTIYSKDAVSITDRVTGFPLYIYTIPEGNAATLLETRELDREPNLSQEFVDNVKAKLGVRFVPDGKGDLKTTFGPEDILHYAYAVFHAPTYRTRYAEFLRIDFPFLPLTSDLALFRGLTGKGEELVSLHLKESPKLNQLLTKFPVVGSNEVGRVRYVEPHQDASGCVYINETQYFEGVTREVWKFQIGGYQVLHKWLKDRKGRLLSFEDLLHYQKVVVALSETIRLMKEIDQLIPEWPID